MRLNSRLGFRASCLFFRRPIIEHTSFDETVSSKNYPHAKIMISIEELNKSLST